MLAVILIYFLYLLGLIIILFYGYKSLLFTLLVIVVAISLIYWNIGILLSFVAPGLIITGVLGLLFRRVTLMIGGKLIAIIILILGLILAFILLCLLMAHFL